MASRLDRQRHAAERRVAGREQREQQLPPGVGDHDLALGDAGRLEEHLEPARPELHRAGDARAGDAALEVDPVGVALLHPGRRGLLAAGWRGGGRRGRRRRGPQPELIDRAERVQPAAGDAGDGDRGRDERVDDLVHRQPGVERVEQRRHARHRGRREGGAAERPRPCC